MDFKTFSKGKKKAFIPKCRALKKEIEELGAKEVTLVFASAYINAPASAFGHTFLRFDKDANTPLLSYAINYAANTNQEKGVLYAYKGLFGGYEGRYSISRYYKKLKEYSALEQRDIWEYTLELSQKEIDRMVRHIFEIRHFYADYFFMSENCSYNLLWLLEVAKDDLKLIDNFKQTVIPLDTIRAIVSKGLVKKTRYRASKHREILKLSEAIKNSPKALQFAKSEEYDLSAIKALRKEKKIASLQLAIALLQQKRTNNKITKEAYLPKFLTLLKARSKLGRLPKKDPQKPSSPLEGHYSTKASITYSKQRVRAKTKIVYHDLYDNEQGYLLGAYINFLETTITYQEHQLKLEEINLLEIKSYAIENTIFKPISWEVALGGKRIFNNGLNSYLQAGAGVTQGNEKLYFYTTITPTLYYKNHEEVSVSANLGLLYNPSKYLKFGLLSSNEWFSKKREILQIEPFITYSINQQSALNLRYEYKKINKKREEELALSWFWYF